MRQIVGRMLRFSREVEQHYARGLITKCGMRLANVIGLTDDLKLGSAQQALQALPEELVSPNQESRRHCHDSRFSYCSTMLPEEIKPPDAPLSADLEKATRKLRSLTHFLGIEFADRCGSAEGVSCER